MAATDEGAALTAAHRQAQLAIRAQAIQDLMRLWPMLDLRRLEETFPPFSAAAETLVRARHDQSAGTAAAYYRAFRVAEDPKVLALRSEVLRVSPLPAVQARAAMSATGIATYTKALRAGATHEQAQAKAFTAAAGALTRLALDGGRKMIDRAVIRDPAAAGYARVTDGNPCHFCAMLAGRGAVYTSETATRTKSGRAYHDKCGCQPEPIIRGTDYRLPGEAAKFADLWEKASVDPETGRQLYGPDAVNAFRRAYERPGLHQH